MAEPSESQLGRYRQQRWKRPLPQMICAQQTADKEGGWQKTHGHKDIVGGHRSRSEAADLRFYRS